MKRDKVVEEPKVVEEVKREKVEEVKLDFNEISSNFSREDLNKFKEEFNKVVRFLKK